MSKWIDCDREGCPVRMKVDELHTKPGIHVSRETPYMNFGDDPSDLDFCSWACLAVHAESHAEPLLSESIT